MPASIVIVTVTAADDDDLKLEQFAMSHGVLEDVDGHRAKWSATVRMVGHGGGQ